MAGPDNTINRPVKDRDLKTITYFLRVAGLAVPFLCLLGFYIGYVHWGLHGAVSGIIIAGIAGLIISGIVMFLLDMAGGAASGLISGRREAVWTTREQVQGFLSQARFNKDNAEYTLAFNYVNKVLDKDPDFAEALILKAQILWEGFSQADAAIQFLEKALSLDDGDKMLHNQARLLHSDLSVLENPADGITPPQGVEIGLGAPKSSVVHKLTSESYQDLKGRMEETPIAVWAIYTTTVFGLFLICVLISMYIQIQKLDSAGSMVSQTIENTGRAAQMHADGIQKIEKKFQSIHAELNRIDKKLKQKK
jgi:tetratricopeptide (TPR) repeat protein